MASSSDAVEQTGLQQVDALQAGIHLQAVQAIGGNGFAVQVDVEGEPITQVIQQPPLEGSQQRLQRPAFGQCQQRRGVVLEDGGMGIFGRQQADQQLIEVEAAEQGFAVEPGRDPVAFHAPDILQFAPSAEFDLQGHERPRQRPGLAPRAPQHRPQASLGVRKSTRALLSR